MYIIDLSVVQAQLPSETFLQIRNETRLTRWRDLSRPLEVVCARDVSEPEIEVDDESYEIKAIKAYLAGDLKARDSRASLEVSRPTMYRMVARYVEFGPDGLHSMDEKRRYLGRS